MIIRNKNNIDYYGKIEEIRNEILKGNQISWDFDDFMRPFVYEYLQIEREDALGEKKSSEYWAKKAESLDTEKFLEFFNKTDPKYSSSFEGGSKDFHDMVMNARVETDTTLSEFMGDTSAKTCLEIGFGGGRLLQEACKIFNFAIGIDIHSYFKRVEKILHESGLTNFDLLKCEKTSEIKSNSVDLVYSFIVMQHVDTFEEIMDHIRTTKRVLKKDGIAVLYFGLNNILPSVGALEITGHEEGGYSMLFNIDYLAKLLSKEKLQPLTLSMTENLRQFCIVAQDSSR